jgi:hypothetical protein
MSFWSNPGNSIKKRVKEASSWAGFSGLFLAWSQYMSGGMDIEAALGATALAVVSIFIPEAHKDDAIKHSGVQR